MMADETEKTEDTSVYLRGEDGKPFEAATFADADDAAAFAHSKLRLGAETLVVQGKPSKEQLESAFPKPEVTAPANSQIPGRVAAAKAAILDEQLNEAARKQAEKELEESSESIEDAIAATNPAPEEEAPAEEAAPAEDEAGPTAKATSSKSKGT
jgi:hypothetical protein